MSHGHGHLHHRAGPPAVQESTFHVHKVSMYMKTLMALVVLMILTVVLAHVHIPDVGPIPGTLLNNIVAMTIATIKAALVINFFMGVKFATKLTKLWVVAGFVGFVLMFLVYGDYTTRKYEPTPRWTSDPGSSMQRSVTESREGKDFRNLPGPKGF